MKKCTWCEKQIAWNVRRYGEPICLNCLMKHDGEKDPFDNQ